MDIQAVREYTLSLPGVTEDFPFDEVTLVFRIENKIFMFLPLDSIPPIISVKNDPDINLELREEYPDAIEGAFHLNKKHWNQIDLTYDWNPELIKGWIDTSYKMILQKLPRALRDKYTV
jgi:predicted DNA-binding protein (MmcQ/YjbR family)